MDRDRFSYRVRCLETRLYRIACGQLRDEADRADAVQEAILRAWQGAHRLRDEEYFETWLVRILINECHNLQRAHRMCVPVEQIPEEAYLPGQYADLHEAIWNLPDRLRLAVQLFYIEGYDTKEIAKILRIPPGTVCTRLKRARTLMKEFLTEEQEGGSLHEKG